MAVSTVGRFVPSPNLPAMPTIPTVPKAQSPPPPGAAQGSGEQERGAKIVVDTVGTVGRLVPAPMCQKYRRVATAEGANRTDPLARKPTRPTASTPKECRFRRCRQADAIFTTLAEFWKLCEATNPSFHRYLQFFCVKTQCYT